MNIVVRTYEGQTYTRPDTSWNRKSEDWYVPEFVEGVSFTPVLYAHISRPGKSILPRFAQRYYNATGMGLLLYSEPISGCAGIAASACLDGTSLLPELSAEATSAPAELLLEGKRIFEFPSQGTDTVNEALSAATGSCLIRRGDLFCLELSPIQSLCSRDIGKAGVILSSRGQVILDFKLIFS